MANIVLFTNNIAQYLPSINTPDYENNPDVLIDPDLSGVEGVPIKYWKRVGNKVVEMTVIEKQALADAELLTRKNAANIFGIQDMKIVLTALIKVINIRLPIGQKITTTEMINALKNEVT